MSGRGGRGGRGGKRTLANGAGGRAATAAKAARAAATSIAPTEQDRRAKDEMRAAAGGTSASHAAAAPADDRVTPPPPPTAPVAARASFGSAVGSLDGSETLPMVEFSEPPPPPLFETTCFPFSPSMAAAAGMLPPMGMGFPDVRGMPSMMPGMQGYGTPFPGSPAAFPSLPGAMPPTNLFGTSTQQHATGLLGGTMPGVSSGAHSMVPALMAPQYNPAPTAAGYSPGSSSFLPTMTVPTAGGAGGGNPAGPLSAGAPAVTVPMAGGAGGGNPTDARSAGAAAMTSPAAVVGPVAPAVFGTGELSGAPTMASPTAVFQPATNHHRVLAPPSTSTAAAFVAWERPAAVVAASTIAASGESWVVGMSAGTVATAPQAGTIWTGEASALGLMPSSTTPPTTSPRAGSGSLSAPSMSPTTPAAVRRPATPPALVRAGRRTGPPRPRISSGIAPVQAPPSAPSAAGPATTTASARRRITPSAATAGPATPPAAAAPAATPSASAPSTTSPPAGAARAARIRRRRSGPAAGRPAGGSAGGSTGGANAGAVEAVISARNRAAGSTREEPAAGSDGVVLVGTVSAANAHATAGGLERVLNGVTSMVTNLAEAVKSIGDKVNTQGRAMESLGVLIGKMNNAAPATVPAPVARRRVQGFVDTDEEYSDYEEHKAMAGKELTVLQRGMLQMLVIRKRAKYRYFGHLGGATITNDVLPDGDADWDMLMEETMDELKLDPPEAYDFLTSAIAPPTKRRTPKEKKGKGKGKRKGKRSGKPKNKSTAARAGAGTDSGSVSSSSSGVISSSDNGAGGDGGAKNDGGDKKKKDDPTVRAYQPMTQSLSHVLEAIKRRVVPAWFRAVGAHHKSMKKHTAAGWLENMNKMPTDPDEVTEEQRNAPVRPRFVCSDDGHEATLAAVKELFIHLGVADRIQVPDGLGNKENIQTTTGHIALVVMFVRAELEQIAAGVRRQRRGKDNGWYDRWRWEILTVHPLMPTTTAPWRGFVVNDVNSPTRCDFEHPPVPINSIRTRTVRVRPATVGSAARGVRGACEEAGGVAAGGADGVHAPGGTAAGGPTGSAALLGGGDESAEEEGAGGALSDGMTT